MTHPDYSIAFIGGGQMAKALIGGVLASGLLPHRLHVSDPNPENRQRLEQTCGIKTYSDNKEAAYQADIIVLATKPNFICAVAEEIAEYVKSHPDSLVISIAAGMRLSKILSILGENTALIRAMPNTPAFIREGACGLFANKACSAQQRQQAFDIFSAVGTVAWVDNEDHLDIVTALSGSGPAYFYLFIEALENAAVELGLPLATAHPLALQTALGAAKMAIESGTTLEQLKIQVTSPGGTTASALKSFEQNHFNKIIQQAIQAAAIRAAELHT
jgi:pyrroline-5-carboxylate reductase